MYTLVWIPVLLYVVKTNLTRWAYLYAWPPWWYCSELGKGPWGFPTCALNDQFTANNLKITLELLRLLESPKCNQGPNMFFIWNTITFGTMCSVDDWSKCTQSHLKNNKRTSTQAPAPGLSFVSTMCSLAGRKNDMIITEWASVLLLVWAQSEVYYHSDWFLPAYAISNGECCKTHFAEFLVHEPCGRTNNPLYCPIVSRHTYELKGT